MAEEATSKSNWQGQIRRLHGFFFHGVEPQGKCCFVSVDGVELLEELGQ